MKLCGDIRSENPYMTPADIDKFLDKLSALMEKYRINKIDVCWSRFNNRVYVTSEFTTLDTNEAK